MTGGSFLRSFLIPGTDTSIRVGGEIRMNSLYWIVGGNPNQNPQSTNAGTTGQLNNAPLVGLPQGSAGFIARERSDNILNMEPTQSKLSVETRTPTAWGEARSFLEFDFAGGVASGSRELSTANSLIPRLRYAYGTIGPVLFGQANSNFNDPDAGLETLDFGGLIGGSGPARVPQIRWTEPLAGWGLLGALSVSAEISGNRDLGPGSRRLRVKRRLRRHSGRRERPEKHGAEMVASWYYPQPWGHVDFATVVRPTLRVEREFGRGIDKTYVGYGFNFSGDVKPRWFGWDKDYIVWGAVLGEAAGRYLYAGSGSSVGLVSNITTATLNSGSTIVKPTRGFSGRIGYQHEWTPNWRSNFGVGYWHLEVPGLNGAVCPAGSRATASGGCGLNTDLAEGVANLIWSPVSFVDIGVEYLVWPPQCRQWPARHRACHREPLPAQVLSTGRDGTPAGWCRQASGWNTWNRARP